MAPYDLRRRSANRGSAAHHHFGRVSAAVGSVGLGMRMTPGEMALTRTPAGPDSAPADDMSLPGV
jgi:hypothetical protein